MICAMTLDAKENERPSHRERIQSLSKFHLTTEAMQMNVINQVSLARFALIYNQVSSECPKDKDQKRRSNCKDSSCIHNQFYSKMGHKCHSW